MISENQKKGVFGTPIPPEDIASETCKTFGIGAGDGGPSDERAGESGVGFPAMDGDISKGCP
jgi:hypothetical protein